MALFGAELRSFVSFCLDRGKPVPRRCMSFPDPVVLKNRIERSLMMEDYSCRLPRPKGHPRYRLRTAYSYLLNSWVWK